MSKKKALQFRDIEELEKVQKDDVLKVKIDNFPVRAKVIKNNKDARIITLSYRIKRHKTFQRKVRALTYEEIMAGQYEDNTKKWIARAAVVGLSAPVGYGLVSNISWAELIPIILKLINSL